MNRLDIWYLSVFLFGILLLVYQVVFDDFQMWMRFWFMLLVPYVPIPIFWPDGKMEKWLRTKIKW